MTWEATYAKRHRTVSIKRPGPPPTIEDLNRGLVSAFTSFAHMLAHPGERVLAGEPGQWPDCDR